MTARRVEDEQGHRGTVLEDDGKGTLRVHWDMDDEGVDVWVPFRQVKVVRDDA
jgi:hypothetical protein